MTGTRLNHKEEEDEIESTNDNSDFDHRTLTGSGSSVTTRKKRRQGSHYTGDDRFSRRYRSSKHSKFE